MLGCADDEILEGNLGRARNQVEERVDSRLEERLNFRQSRGFHSEETTSEDGFLEDRAEDRVDAFESEQVKVGEVGEDVDPEFLGEGRVGEEGALRHGVRVAVVVACRGVGG